MATRITVLGSSGAWPEPGRACNGFLIEHDGYRVALDLGYATLPRLLAALGSEHAAGLDAIVVTHEHPDHMLDLHPLFRARWFGRRLGLPTLPLFAPRGVVEAIARVELDKPEMIGAIFDWFELPGTYDVGPFRLTGVALPHFVPNSGVRLAAPDLTVAYTGDTGPAPELTDLARDADLLIAEASDRHQQPGIPPAPAGSKLYLDAPDAGRLATDAGAHRLMLTHFWPGSRPARRPPAPPQSH